MDELEKDIADARQKGLALSVDGGVSQAPEPDAADPEAEG
jgi:hypothetical protein